MADENSRAAEVLRLASPGAGLSQLAIEWLPRAVLVMRVDGTIAVVNRQLERVFGYARDELIGQPIDTLLAEFPWVVHVSGRAALITSAGTDLKSVGHLRARHRDGSRFDVHIDLNPLQTAEGTFVLVVISDDTASRDAEAACHAIEERVSFEQLVAELSVRFINLPAEHVDEAIHDALGRIGEELDLDRCNFYRIPADGVLADPVSWSRAGFPPAPAPVKAEQSFPWALETLRAGKVVCFSTVDEIPNPVDRENYRRFGIRSAVTVPLSVGGDIVGAVGFNALRDTREWHPETLHRLTVIAAAFGNVLARQKGDEALQKALAEVHALRDQLQAENLYLRREVLGRFGGPIIGQSAAIRRVLAQLEQVAATDSTVLLLGETGTGKELFATRIHQLSRRRGRAMVRVNCAAIPATLIESELFGREKGAFTGALSRQIGRFELADHSTIFLDEIGDLPADIQVKLLRVLEERQIERLGSPKGIPVDVRIIAATHRDLEDRIAEGAFRDDLFYRLNVFPIHVPALRDRADDIPLLVWRFVDEFSKVFGKRIDAIPRTNMEALQRYAWPGNIRELRNIIERALIVARSSRLTVVLPIPAAGGARHSVKLADVEKEHIRSVLENSNWRIRGVGGAADRLGLRPTTLETRMAKLGLTRPKP